MVRGKTAAVSTKVASTSKIANISKTAEGQAASQRRYKDAKSNPFLRRGEKPSERPTWQKSEIDDMMRYRKAGYNVEPQASFLDGQRCKNGTLGSIRVDNYIEGLAAVEMKNYNLTNNVNGLINNVAEQAMKHQQHLPKGTRQIYKIDARGQVCTPHLENKVKEQIVSKSKGILSADDIHFIRK